MKNYKKYEKLVNEFILISQKGWNQSVCNDTGGVGLTFESLLDKKADSMFFPDYYGTEIKCTTRFSGYPISLFSKSFDGPLLYEMNRILEKYGRDDNVYQGRKLLNVDLKVNEKVLVNNKYFFKLQLDYKQEKMFLFIYDIKGNLLENDVYIDFDSLKVRLQTKLSSLSIVYASKKIIDKKDYFRYYKMSIYELISTEKFIELIEKNKIVISLVGRVSRSGTGAGRQRNNGLIFKIPKDNINELFKEIVTYNLDKMKYANDNILL